MTSAPRLPTHAFLVLPENRFAHTAISALVSARDEAPIRPVFLCGSSGVGKTHLASQAIWGLLGVAPKARAEQWTASQFAAEFAEASSNRTIPLFQSVTRQLDLLVLEDLPALEGRIQTQIQLLSLTNELLSTGCRIVWTSRKSPGELSQFLPKLVSRFRGGILCPLRKPGPESRRLLVQHFARSRQVVAAPGALRLLAEKLAVSPRELLAAVQQLGALGRHERRPIDSDLVRKFLAHDVPPPQLKIEDICRSVARQFGTTATELRSRRRTQSAALPRKCAMFLAREMTPCSLQQIGRYFGGRDHSTVVHSCQRLTLLLERQPDLRSYLNQVRHELGVGPGPAPTKSLFL
ncbi:MAG: hypothetical protein EXS05_24665 [Planctomycetaceae bacterium]|nr:hypothetical protein [Planctomycetaceae bacterium]